MAGDLLDAVLRALCAFSFAAKRQQEFSYLEIGVLHGINLIGTYEAIRHRFNKVMFTAIDPFAGYYGEPVDPLGMPVSQKVFEDNLALFAVPQEDIRLFVGSSLDPIIQDAQKEQSYDLLFVDGDHSYEGVKGDCDFYCNLLKPQGLLIIDNYDDGTCPGVTEFVNNELLTSNAYIKLGIVGRTIVFRRC